MDDKTLQVLSEDTAESVNPFKLDSEKIQILAKSKEVERLSEEVETLKQDREQRVLYSERLFVFLCIYMMFALLIVVACGMGKISLSDTVIVAVITTAFANVIGIFAFVAKYLFHR